MMSRNVFQNVRVYLVVFILLFVPVASVMAMHATDGISISTDRAFYVVGELVHIKVYRPKVNDSYKIKRDYVYCDLISQGGDMKLSQKLMLIDGSGELQMKIPKNTKSGYYIIRAYTRQMRTEPLSYAFVEIKIVNIIESDVVGKGRLQGIKLTEDSNIKNAETTIDGLLSNYKRRDSVSFKINVDTSIYCQESLSISVVPKLSFFNNKLKSSLLHKLVIDTNINFAEKRGFTLSGYISQSDSTKTVAGKVIYLSVRGTKQIQTTISDSVGRFYVSMPKIYNEHSVYISTDTVDKNAKIFINKDNDQYFNYLLNKEFRLSSEEKKMALLLSQNVAINESFAVKLNKQKESEAIIIKPPFYYKADETVVIMDYVDMPKLGMYFTELPGRARLYKKHKKTKIKVLASNDVPLVLDPLILIDYVAVNDLDEILKINPKSINRIEVVNQYYQLGDVSFGGIISFISNNDDFGGFNFAKSAMVINYSFLNECASTENRNTSVSMPDTRTTLYWNAKPKIEDRAINVEFTTSDVAETYSVIIEGVKTNGDRFYFTKDFIVK